MTEAAAEFGYQHPDFGPDAIIKITQASAHSREATHDCHPGPLSTITVGIGLHLNNTTKAAICRSN